MSLTNDAAGPSRLAATGFPFTLVALFALAWIGVGVSVVALRKRIAGEWPEA